MFCSSLNGDPGQLRFAMVGPAGRGHKILGQTASHAKEDSNSMNPGNDTMTGHEMGLAGLFRCLFTLSVGSIMRWVTRSR